MRKEENVIMSSEMIRTFSPRIHLYTACWTRMRSASPWLNVIFVRFVCVGLLITISTGTQSSQCSDIQLWVLIGCVTSYYGTHIYHILIIQHTVEPLTNDHVPSGPSLSYDHISCDGQWFLFVYESLTSDNPSYTTTTMRF